MSTAREIIAASLSPWTACAQDAMADAALAALAAAGLQVVPVEPTERPFSCDDVEQLARHQMASKYHPFTCQNRGDGKHRNAYGDLGALVATVRGWVCPFCDYTQNWAHGFMKAGPPSLPAPPALPKQGEGG